MPNPERLDIAPAAPSRGGWLLVAVLVVVVALCAVLAWRSGLDRTSPEPSTSTSHPRPTTRPTLVPSMEGTRLQPPLPTSTSDGWYWTAVHSYDAPSGLRLLLASERGLVRVDLAHGRLAVFATPPSNRPLDGLGSLVAIDDGVLFQRDDRAPYLLGNFSQLTRLPEAATGSAALVRWFPGPSRQWPLWRDVDVMGHHTVAAVDLSGHTLPVTLPQGVEGWAIRSDGRGGLLAHTVEGTTFAVGLDRTTRLTDAPVVAVGPTRLLTAPCDGDGQCWYEVIDPTGHTPPRHLPGAVLRNAEGTVSPDGSTAILQWQVADGRSQLTLIDLTTGEQRPAGQLDTYATGLAWSPDSALVVSSLWLDRNSEARSGLLLVVDVRNAKPSQLLLPGAGAVGAVVVDPYDRPGWA